MRAVWKVIVIMTLILVISLATISYIGKQSGNLDKDSLAYKVISAESHIEEVISKTYKEAYNSLIETR